MMLLNVNLLTITVSNKDSNIKKKKRDGRILKWKKVRRHGTVKDGY